MMIMTMVTMMNSMMMKMINLQVQHPLKHTTASLKHTITAPSTFNTHHTDVHDLATHDRAERLPGPGQPDQVPAAALSHRGDVQGHQTLLRRLQVQRREAQEGNCLC